MRNRGALINIGGLAVGMALLMTACGEGLAGSPSRPDPITPQGTTTTEAPATTSTEEAGLTCGTALPVFPSTFAGSTAADYLGTVGPAADSPPTAPGQYAAHWQVADGLTMEIRWPADPLPEATAPYEVHDELILGQPIPFGAGSLLVAEVGVSDDPADPCAKISVLAMGPIPDQLQDEMRHFAEGLRPIDTLDQALAADTVALVDCPAAPPQEPAHGEVRVFVECGPLMRYPSFPVVRPIPDDTNDLEAALLGLVRGTTAEEQDLLLGSGFDQIDPDEAARIEVEASVDARGVAHVDFFLEGESWGPGLLASTSHQVLSFIDPLYATVFQFDGVTALDHTGLCWGELACDEMLTRAEWQAMTFINRRVRVDGECPLSASWTDSTCWLGSPAAAPVDRGVVVDVAADDTLNVRAGSGVEFPIVEKLDPGASVGVTGITATSSDGGSWRVIHITSGNPGWVNEAYIEIVQE